MKIELDYDKLKMFFATLIENNMSCNECPFYDVCDGREDNIDCAELYIEQLTKEEEKC